MTEHEDLLTRDGDLSELTLLRYEAGELTGTQLDFVERRLAEQGPEQARLDEILGFSDDNAIAPPEDLIAREAANAPARSWRSWWGLGSVVAAAAVVLLIVSPTGPDHDETWAGPVLEGPPPPLEAEPDTIRSKGRPFDFRVQLEEGGTTRWVGSGAQVHGGDRIQFVVYPRKAGHLMILGRGPDGQTYPCHPRQPGEAVPIGASSTAVELEGAVAFDDVLGDERIVALLCEESFGYDEVASVLADADDTIPDLRDGCDQIVVELHKEAPTEADGDVGDVVDGSGALDPLGNPLDEARDPPSSAPPVDDLDDPGPEDGPEDGPYDEPVRPGEVVPQ